MSTRFYIVIVKIKPEPKLEPSVDRYQGLRIEKKMPRRQLPVPILDGKPDFIELYWKAWESAWEHVLIQPGMPEPKYIDEAMTPSTIWIWDTCFMALFCKYGANTFPGIESLNNFYSILHDHTRAAAKIHFADNPPLFAWVEWQYYRMTGNIERIKWLLHEKQYLQKHFDLIEHSKPGKKLRGVRVRLSVKREPLGYRWRGNTSGMDNTPRGRNRWNNTQHNPRGQIMHNSILWLDLLAQQALAAECISLMAAEIHEGVLAAKFKAEHAMRVELLNSHYWDSDSKAYYDIERKSNHRMDNPEFNKVLTIATYWPMLAGACSEQQAVSLKEKLLDPDIFGGQIPFPSLSRSDPDFDPLGRYWRGGVWLPTIYMATKALDRYSYTAITKNLAQKVLDTMVKTYHRFTPHTIWECYSPTESKPSTSKRNKLFVRENFCGWSALGPISMLIENVLGFQEINAPKKTIKWNIGHSCRHGIKNLHFGDIEVDLIFENGNVTVKSTRKFDLYLIYGSKQKTMKIQQGECEILLEEWEKEINSLN